MLRHRQTRRRYVTLTSPPPLALRPETTPHFSIFERARRQADTIPSRPAPFNDALVRVGAVECGRRFGYADPTSRTERHAPAIGRPRRADLCRAVSTAYYALLFVKIIPGRQRLRSPGSRRPATFLGSRSPDGTRSRFARCRRDAGTPRDMPGNAALHRRTLMDKQDFQCSWHSHITVSDPPPKQRVRKNIINAANESDVHHVSSWN